MKINIFLLLISIVIFSCSSDDSEFVNSPPQNLTIEKISFEGKTVTIDCSETFKLVFL